MEKKVYLIEMKKEDGTLSSTFAGFIKGTSMVVPGILYNQAIKFYDKLSASNVMRVLWTHHDFDLDLMEVTEHIEV